MILFPGMANLGNTCFANSVLQCLAHTKYVQGYCAQSFHSRCCNSPIKSVADGGDPSGAAQSSQGGARNQSGLRRTNPGRDTSGREANPDSGAASSSSGAARKLKSLLDNNQYVKVAMQDENFCCFCIMEEHVKSAIRQRDGGTRSIVPLSVIILINKISDQFQIGQQADA